MSCEAKDNNSVSVMHGQRRNDITDTKDSQESTSLTIYYALKSSLNRR